MKNNILIYAITRSSIVSKLNAKEVLFSLGALHLHHCVTRNAKINLVNKYSKRIIPQFKKLGFTGGVSIFLKLTLSQFYLFL